MDILTTLKKARFVVDMNGKTVAVQFDLKDWQTILDYLERLQLGSSDEFWRLMADRRKQKTMSREQLEKRLEQIQS